MAAAPNLLHSETPDHKRYFFTHLGLTERLLERCLGEALSAGGEFADLYFEAVTSTSLGMDEGIVKTAAQGISVGCGIRVLSGERTGFAYTDDLSPDRLLKAARTAALIASGPQTQRVQGFANLDATRTSPGLPPTPRYQPSSNSSSAPTRQPATSIRASRRFAPPSTTSSVAFSSPHPTAHSPRTRSHSRASTSR
jgi:hypothetical protein